MGGQGYGPRIELVVQGQPQKCIQDAEAVLALSEDFLDLNR
jgi:hypothetical protein